VLPGCVRVCWSVSSFVIQMKRKPRYRSIGSTAFVAENTVRRLLPRDVGECEGLSERGEGAVPGTRVPSWYQHLVSELGREREAAGRAGGAVSAAWRACEAWRGCGMCTGQRCALPVRSVLAVRRGEVAGLCVGLCVVARGALQRIVCRSCRVWCDRRRVSPER
jgi:hypothetical protein